MAKPIAANDLPPPWGGAGNYGATVYSQFLPWQAPNPLFPGATPWSGQPRLDAATIVSFANNGFEPQLPTPASPHNEYMRRLQVYTQWVEDGTFAADATAHVVETDAAGVVFAVLVEATNGVQGAGATPIDLPQGAALAASKDIVGAASTTISAESIVADETASAQRFQIAFGGTTANNQLWTDALSKSLRWRDDDGVNRYTHSSVSGFARATGVNNAATAPAITTNLDTSTRTGLIGVGDVWVHAVAEVQRAAVGLVRISIYQGDGAIGPEAFAIVGAGVQKTVVGTLDPDDWTTVNISRRVVAPGTITRTYRLEVFGLGANTAAIRESWIHVDGFTG